MRLALYEPDIPQNTGTMLRMAACLGVAVDIILPAGFDVSSAKLRRAGLDYLDHVSITRHESWAAFNAWRNDGRVGACAGAAEQGRLVLLSTRAETSYLDHAFRADDILLVGRESAGVPDHVHDSVDARVIVPMRPGLRSLNVAVAAAIVLGEALRQTERSARPRPP